MPTDSKAAFTFAQRMVLAIVPRVVWVLLWIVGLTWRYEVIAEEGVVPVLHGQKPGQGSYCFWHQCVLPCTMYFRWSEAVILISLFCWCVVFVFSVVVWFWCGVWVVFA